MIVVAGSENIYSIQPSTLQEMIGVSTEWESPFTLPSGSQRTLPMAEVRMRISDQERTTVCAYSKAGGEPPLGRHAILSLDADHGKQNLVSTDMFLS